MCERGTTAPDRKPAAAAAAAAVSHIIQTTTPVMKLFPTHSVRARHHQAWPKPAGWHHMQHTKIVEQGGAEQLHSRARKATRSTDSWRLTAASQWYTPGALETPPTPFTHQKIPGGGVHGHVAKQHWHCPQKSRQVNLVSGDPPWWFAPPTAGWVCPQQQPQVY
jgi:hypothetical protein